MGNDIKRVVRFSGFLGSGALGVDVYYAPESMDGTLHVEPLWGCYPHWRVVLGALECLQHEGRPLLEWIREWGKECQSHSPAWRLEEWHGEHGNSSFRVRIRDAVAKEWGTPGAIRSQVYLTCARKLPKEGLFIRLSDWPALEGPVMREVEKYILPENVKVSVEEVATGVQYVWTEPEPVVAGSATQISEQVPEEDRIVFASLRAGLPEPEGPED